MNLAIFIIIIAPLKKKKNSRILNFVKNLKIKNLKHAKITRSRVFEYRKAIHFVSKFENLYRNIKPEYKILERQGLMVVLMYRCRMQCTVWSERR